MNMRGFLSRKKPLLLPRIHLLRPRKAVFSVLVIGLQLHRFLEVLERVGIASGVDLAPRIAVVLVPLADRPGGGGHEDEEEGEEGRRPVGG